jgi:hypothetical protein
MSGLPSRPEAGGTPLAELKERLRPRQGRAAAALDAEPLSLHREIGRTIVERQERFGWGNGVLDRPARDLRRVFLPEPGRGFALVGRPDPLLEREPRRRR